MKPEAIVFMLLVCGFVWGGFAALLWRALRHEDAKRREAGGA